MFALRSLGLIWLLYVILPASGDPIPRPIANPNPFPNPFPIANPTPNPIASPKPKPIPNAIPNPNPNPVAQPPVKHRPIIKPSQPPPRPPPVTGPLAKWKGKGKIWDSGGGSKPPPGACPTSDPTVFVTRPENMLPIDVNVAQDPRTQFPITGFFRIAVNALHRREPISYGSELYDPLTDSRFSVEYTTYQTFLAREPGQGLWVSNFEVGINSEEQEIKALNGRTIHWPGMNPRWQMSVEQEFDHAHPDSSWVVTWSKFRQYCKAVFLVPNFDYSCGK
ncbi:hypothetical protein FKW77_000976 [Venturia effusa]|uniref:Enterotoxin n=1 Tax=Venturia effusa TaxID=50376 RepID=A0A517KVS2_9PEZI|nr:hypothetical protein FKW77_000976 [Venturia effusa]